MTVEIKLDGLTIRRSRNLRGIMDYARKNVIKTVTIKAKWAKDQPNFTLPVYDTATLTIVWENGATVTVEWGSYALCWAWCRSKVTRCGWPKAIIDSTP